jgi:hypothetical protein
VEVDTESDDGNASGGTLGNEEGETGNEEEDAHEGERNKEKGATTVGCLRRMDQYGGTKKGGDEERRTVDGVDGGSGENPVECTETERGAESRDLVETSLTEDGGRVVGNDYRGGGRNGRRKREKEGKSGKSVSFRRETTPTTP